MDLQEDLIEYKTDELEKVREEVAVCVKCPLSKSRTKTVPGEGSYHAEIMFVGEAPGVNEDLTGVPFCGAAGKFLDEMLSVIGFKREDVFVANTVKCRPPQNRDPEDSEKSACRPYLDRQLKLISPKIIICLGRHSMASFLPGQSISKVHGKPMRRPNGRVILPLYHPAAALHNGSLRATLIEDFKKIPQILEKIKEESHNKVEEKNTLSQLKLI